MSHDPMNSAWDELRRENDRLRAELEQAQWHANIQRNAHEIAIAKVRDELHAVSQANIKTHFDWKAAYDRAESAERELEQARAENTQRQAQLLALQTRADQDRFHEMQCHREDLAQRQALEERTVGPLAAGPRDADDYDDDEPLYGAADPRAEKEQGT